VGWSQLWSYSQDKWLIYKINPYGDPTITAANLLVDQAVREEARWTVAAQAAFARHKHNATIYTVGLAANNSSIDEPILRQLANQQVGGAAYDASQKIGKYYRVRNTSDLAGVFADIARQAGGVLVE
jgi:hypothetical protein